MERLNMSRYKKIGLAVMIIGLTAGSIVTNMTYESNYYFLAELGLSLTAIKEEINVNALHYAAYIVGKRMYQMILLAVFLKLFVLEAVIIILGFLISFSFGMFLTYQMLQEGLGSLAAVFLTIFPQWICYGISLYFWVKGEEKKGKKEAYRYYVGFILFLLLGLVSESFVNPQLLSM